MEGYTLGILITTTDKTTDKTSTTSTTTSGLVTDVTSEPSTGFIPLNEVHKDIILLSLVGVFLFTFLVLICVLTRNKRRNDMTMEFQNLTATSSTTVFDKRQ